MKRVLFVLAREDELSYPRAPYTTTMPSCMCTAIREKKVLAGTTRLVGMTERRRNRFTFSPKKVACSSPKGTTRYLTPSEAPYIKGWYTLGDKLQQHVATARRSDKSLRVYWRIFVKIFVSATEFCRSNTLQKIKSDRICATCTHGVICRRDVLLQLVA